MAALTPEQQIEAAELYRSGLSVQQVADYFSISLNAAFYSLRHLNVTRRSSAESNQIRFEAQPLSYSIKENLTRADEDLKLTAVMLYWAEGYKVGGQSVDFANSDPNMALIFKKFLSEICRVDESRIRCSLYCYQGQDIESLHKFWSNLLSVPSNQFSKPYIKVAVESTPSWPANDSRPCTCQIL